MSNLIPTQVPDKRGFLTTRNKKTLETPAEQQARIKNLSAPVTKDGRVAITRKADDPRYYPTLNSIEDRMSDEEWFRSMGLPSQSDFDERYLATEDDLEEVEHEGVTIFPYIDENGVVRADAHVNDDGSAWRPMMNQDGSAESIFLFKTAPFSEVLAATMSADVPAIHATTIARVAQQHLDDDASKPSRTVRETLKKAGETLDLPAEETRKMVAKIFVALGRERELDNDLYELGLQ